ncbi:hypothetical protein CEXT_64771 [Caerostris extrusa]|uniref:Uncharacterized protein n=1 Tax=Caerostris extrusa TaxID=172846 RepID=A0AAV4RLD0_CAEEX|nr:hypothetical protein CEXT_64771 [Caerostris extrusa]
MPKTISTKRILEPFMRLRSHSKLNVFQLKRVLQQEVTVETWCCLNTRHEARRCNQQPATPSSPSMDL